MTIGKGVTQLFDRIADQRVLRRWTAAAGTVEDLKLPDLKVVRGQARQLRTQLDRVCRAADGRLSLPAAGGGAIEKPIGADWCWRPQVWREAVVPGGMAAVASGTRMNQELAVFHDCRSSELSLRQVHNTGATDLAACGLRMDVFRFDGSFLSLAIDLPDAATTGLTRRHLVGLSLRAEMERPLEIFARLNIRHGPNTERLVRELPLGTTEAQVEFDLAYVELNEKRIEAAWVDLIFEGPEMNQVLLRDLTMYRRPRAEI